MASGTRFWLTDFRALGSGGSGFWDGGPSIPSTVVGYKCFLDPGFGVNTPAPES